MHGGNLGWRAGRVAIAVGFGMFAACSAFSGSDDPPATQPAEQPDAGTNPPPVGGDPKGEVTLAVPAALTLVHGKTLVLDVAITRVPPFTAGMTLTVRGLPGGIAAQPVDVVPTESTAKIDMAVAATAVQGALGGVTLEARNGTAILGTIPLAGVVQGSSGELDTTFGTKGFVSLDSDANQLAMREDGAFYVLEVAGSMAVRKYTKDGVLDTTFGGGTGLYLSGPTTPMTAIAWHAPHLFVAGGVEGASPSWYIRRLDGDGKVDATYGTGGTYLKPAATPNHVASVGIGASGEAVVAGTATTGGNTVGGVLWATSAGTFEGGLAQVIAAGSPVTQVIREATRTVGIGPTNTSVFVTSGTYNSDPTWKYPGFGPTIAFTSIVRDGAGNYVLGGRENDTDLVIARVDTNGIPDPNFANSGALHTAISTNGGGGFVTVTGDKIVQLGTVLDGQIYRCHVARYTSTGVSDTTFGQVGKSVPPIDDCYAGQVAAQPDGRLVVSGAKLFRLWP